MIDRTKGLNLLNLHIKKESCHILSAVQLLLEVKEIFLSLYFYCSKISINPLKSSIILGFSPLLSSTIGMENTKFS